MGGKTEFKLFVLISWISAGVSARLQRATSSMSPVRKAVAVPRSVAPMAVVFMTFQPGSERGTRSGVKVSGTPSM